MFSCGYIEFIDWTTCINFDLLTWPAWIQAIGSLVAIGVAFYIFRIDHRRQAREDRLKARSIAILLIAPLTEMLSRLALLQQSNKVVGRADIEIPTIVLSQIENFYLLEDAGEKIQQIIGDSYSFSQLMNRQESDVPLAINHDHKVVGDMIKTLNGALIDLKKIRGSKV